METNCTSPMPSRMWPKLNVGVLAIAGATGAPEGGDAVFSFAVTLLTCHAYDMRPLSSLLWVSQCDTGGGAGAGGDGVL